jgi:hypothetical protein
LHGALRLRLLLPVGSPVQPKPVLPDAAVIREKDEELLLQVCLCHDREADMLVLSSDLGFLARHGHLRQMRVAASIAKEDAAILVSCCSTETMTMR